MGNSKDCLLGANDPRLLKKHKKRDTNFTPMKSAFRTSWGHLCPAFPFLLFSGVKIGKSTELGANDPSFSENPDFDGERTPWLHAWSDGAEPVVCALGQNTHDPCFWELLFSMHCVSCFQGHHQNLPTCPSRDLYMHSKRLVSFSPCLFFLLFLWSRKAQVHAARK